MVGLLTRLATTAIFFLGLHERLLFIASMAHVRAVLFANPPRMDFGGTEALVDDALSFSSLSLAL